MVARYAKPDANVNGWFAVSRAIFDHPVVGAGSEGRFSRMEAWLWLVKHAARKPTADLKPGELIVTQCELAKTWGWTRSKLRAFLDSLVRDHMATITATKTATKVSLTNYGDWQFVDPHDDQPSDPTTARSTTNIYKEDTRQETKEVIVAAATSSVLEAFNSYNALALKLGLPQATALTRSRKQLLTARLKEHGAEAWQRALANVEASKFLRGENDRNWRASLDFLLQASSYGKVLDGAYGSHLTRLREARDRGTTIRDTSESIGDYTARMIREGKFRADA